MRTREKSEDSGSERTCIVTGLEGTRRRRCCASRCAGEGVGHARYPAQAARPRRLDAARASDGAPGGAETGVCARVSQRPRRRAEVADEVDRLLEQDALRFLSLVNKAGLVVTGAAKVEAAIARRPVAGLIHAERRRAGRGGKLDRPAVAALGGRGSGCARINLFPSRQLDLALGRANVIHAALSRGAASSAFLAKVGASEPISGRAKRTRQSTTAAARRRERRTLGGRRIG